MPGVLSGWVQLGFNLLICGCCIYLLFTFFTTLKHDVDTKVQLFSEEIVEQIGKCAKDYQQNRCEPSVRVPAMEQACRNWEACMNRDPYTVARRSKFSGETLGEAMNGFFEQLTWKTITCMALLFFGMCLCYNVVFFFANKQRNAAMAPFANWAPPPAYLAPHHAQPYPRELAPHLPRQPALPHWGEEPPRPTYALR